MADFNGDGLLDVGSPGNHYHSSGEGHVYQGRFKSFPVQKGAHFFIVCRYVERNAGRA